MALPPHLEDLRTLLRRLVLAEVLSPPGRPGPLEPPPCARIRSAARRPRSWVKLRRLPRTGRR